MVYSNGILRRLLIRKCFLVVKYCLKSRLELRHPGKIKKLLLHNFDHQTFTFINGNSS